MRDCVTTLQSEMGDEKRHCLRQLLQGNLSREKVLEIGTAAGGTLKELMSCYTPEERPVFVVVDPMTYFPGQLETVKANLVRGGIDPSEVDFRIGRSDAVFNASAAIPETFSFILIDGAHKARHVILDLRWASRLESGGFLCMDDYLVQTKGVITSTDRFLKRNKNYRAVKLVEGLLVIQKTAPTLTLEVTGFDLLSAHLVGFWHQIELVVQKRWRGFRQYRLTKKTH